MRTSDFETGYLYVDRYGDVWLCDMQNACYTLVLAQRVKFEPWPIQKHDVEDYGPFKKLVIDRRAGGRERQLAHLGLSPSDFFTDADGDAWFYDGAYYWLIVRKGNHNKYPTPEPADNIESYGPFTKLIAAED